MNNESEQTAKAEIPAETPNCSKIRLNYITTDKFYAKVGTFTTDTGFRHFVEVKVDKVNKIGQVFYDGVLKFEVKAVNIGACDLFQVVMEAGLKFIGIRGKRSRKRARRLAEAASAAPVEVERDTVIGRATSAGEEA